MTSRTPRIRRWPLVAALLVGGALVAAPGAAIAATTPKDSHSREVTVTVPSATPTAKPSTAPTTNPPSTNPTYPPMTGGTGGTNTGGTNTGGTNTGGAGSKTGTGTTTPRSGGAAGTATPSGEGAPGAAACVPKEPAVPTTPATSGGDAAVNKSVYLTGETVTATAGGFGPNEQVQLVFFTEPALVGSFAADAAGAVTAQFAVSAETLAGTHVAQFTGWCGTIATVDVLVGAANADSASNAGQQGVPVWAWWVGGGLGLALLVGGAWWALVVMRAPGAEAVTA